MLVGLPASQILLDRHLPSESYRSYNTFRSKKLNYPDHHHDQTKIRSFTLSHHDFVSIIGSPDRPDLSPKFPFPRLNHDHGIDTYAAIELYV